MKSSAGFTLLEVVVALSVLAISLSVLIPIFSGIAHRQTIDNDRRIAIMLAQSKLASIDAQPIIEDGTFDDMFDNGFGSHLLIEPYAIPATILPVIAKSATLTVYWPKKDGPYQLTVATLKLTTRRQ